MPPIQLVILTLIVDVVAMAPLTAWLAQERGRSTDLWFVSGALAGPLALLLVAVIPKVEITDALPEGLAIADQVLPVEPREVGQSDVHLIADEPARIPMSNVRGVSWSRLGLSGSVRSETDQLVRTIAALSVPADQLFGRGRSNARKAQRASQPSRQLIGPDDDDAEIDEDQPLRLRQRPRRRQRRTGPGSNGERPLRLISSAPQERQTPPRSSEDRPTAPAQLRPVASADTRFQGRPEETGAQPIELPPRSGSFTSICIGVFLGGTSDLLIGERYIIEIDETALDIAEATAITRRPRHYRLPLHDGDLAEFEDWFVIGNDLDAGRRVRLAFRGTPTERMRELLPSAPTQAYEADALRVDAARRWRSGHS